MSSRLPAIFVTVVVAVAAVLFAYDRWVVEPRLTELGESERVSLAEARDEAARIAGDFDASVDRSLADAEQALVAQAQERERQRIAESELMQDQIDAARARSQAGEVLARAAMVKTALAEYYMTMGEWPPSLAAAGLGAPGDHAGGPVQSIDLESGGTIAVRVRDDVSRGAVVRLVPKANAMGSIEWSCRASDFPAMADVPGCS